VSDLSIEIFIKSSPLMILMIWTSVFSGALNAYKHFRIAALSPAFRAIVTIFYILTMKGQNGVHSIVEGYIIGELTRLTILYTIFKVTSGIRIKFNLSFFKRAYNFALASSYLILGMVFYALIPIINNTVL